MEKTGDRILCLLKQSGYIMRLRNSCRHEVPLELSVNGKPVHGIGVCDALERETGVVNPKSVKADSVITVKITDIML